MTKNEEARIRIILRHEGYSRDAMVEEIMAGIKSKSISDGQFEGRYRTVHNLKYRPLPLGWNDWKDVKEPEESKEAE